METSASYSMPPPQTILPEGITAPPAQLTLLTPRTPPEDVGAPAAPLSRGRLALRPMASGASSSAPCLSVRASTSNSLELPCPPTAHTSGAAALVAAPSAGGATSQTGSRSGHGHAASHALCQQLKELLQSDNRGMVLSALREQGLSLTEGMKVEGLTARVRVARPASAASRGSPTALYRPMREIMQVGRHEGDVTQVRG